MNKHVYRMIVKSVMTRMPADEESAEDFFIGFDAYKRPYLLLPTPAIFQGDVQFAIRLIADPANRFQYRLDSDFIRMPFRRFWHFFDDKTYFFGPEDNMLQQFLQSPAYRAYKEWMAYLHERVYKVEKRQIS